MEADTHPAFGGHVRAVELVGEVGSWHMLGGPAGAVVCSPKCAALHGVAADHPPGDLDALLTHVLPDDRDAVRAALVGAFDSGSYKVRYRIVRPDGTRRTVDAAGFVDELDGQPILYGAVHDVTADEHAVARLVAAESRFGAIVEHASEGILILNADGVATFVNRKAAEILGRPLSELLGKRPSELADDLPTDMNSERRSHFEARTERADGSGVWILAAFGRLPEEKGGGSVLIVSDITARKRFEQQLRDAADRDALTGLLSRSRLEQAIGQQLRDAHERSEPLSVLFLDLDQFKYVNDSFGHSAGDALLRDLGTLLPTLLRDEDVVGRFAGDEFVIVLPRANEDLARRVGARLLEAIRSRHWQFLSRLTASLGLAVAQPGRETTTDELLIAADSALRDAKESGRNRLSVYTGTGGAAFAWIDEITAAIEEDRLELYAQPIVPLKGDAETRYELLLRMNCGNGTVIAPWEFIPAAEQFGLINEIDRWVVRRAVEIAALGPTVEVNLSGASLGDEQILAIVRSALHGGLDPMRLIFEVTETAAAHNMDAAREFATALQDLGCRFALDDFGTGFGSLTYLKYLPIDQLKIDLDFVRDIAVSSEDRRLVEAITRMAEALDLHTVAEGVEDAATLEVLKEIGVDFAQGFHIGRPSSGYLTGTRGSSRPTEKTHV